MCVALRVCVLLQVLSSEALERAKAEAEATARKQLEAIVADSSKTDEERKRARGAIKAQAAEMEAMTKKIEESAKWVGCSGASCRGECAVC